MNIYLLIIIIYIYRHGHRTVVFATACVSIIIYKMALFLFYSLVGWLGFYSISTLLGYLMLNPVHTMISNIYDL